MKTPVRMRRGLSVFLNCKTLLLPLQIGTDVCVQCERKLFGAVPRFPATLFLSSTRKPPVPIPPVPEFFCLKVNN